jgi:hypothetical protein
VLVEVGLACRVGGLGVVVGVDEQVGHGLGPALPVGVGAVERGQVSQEVGVIPISGY